MMEWDDRLEKSIRDEVGRVAHLWSSHGYDGILRARLAEGATYCTHIRVAQPAPTFTVKTRRDADAVVVVLAGELDLPVAQTVRAALRRAMREPGARLIVDLSGLTFIDSSGLHIILDAYKQCRGAGPTFTIRPGPPNVQQMFELTKTLDYLPFESNA